MLWKRRRPAPGLRPRARIPDARRSIEKLWCPATKKRVSTLIGGLCLGTRGRALGLELAAARCASAASQAAKPGQLVAGRGARIVPGTAAYVSRGGLKLEAALDAFGLDVQGRVALDIGASARAASPMSCSRRERPRSMPWMSEAASFTRVSGRIAGSSPLKQPTPEAERSVVPEPVSAIVAV